MQSLPVEMLLHWGVFKSTRLYLIPSLQFLTFLDLCLTTRKTALRILSCNVQANDTAAIPATHNGKVAGTNNQNPVSQKLFI
jgi:hypothetical protein